MSGGLDVLQMKEEDVLKFLAAGTHLGGTNLDFQMDQYVYKRKSDGECNLYGENCPCKTVLLFQLVAKFASNFTKSPSRIHLFHI